MAEHIQNNGITTGNEHGSVRSYVIGFILSLVLTAIPYYMVTEQLMTGRTLLLIILGIALAQMFVQIFFFLHLGRGPKPLYNVIFFGATAGLIVLVVGASLLIMDNLYRNMSPQEITVRMAQEENIAELNGLSTGACQGNNANHIVVISSESVQPQYIEASRCDTLSFAVEDGEDHMIMFGSYEEPVSYGGMYDVIVRSDRSKIITLNEVGNFTYHDHSNPDIIGSFSVVEP